MPGGAATEISWSPATGSSSAAASVTTADEVDRARAAAARPASARASSSRSATRRRIRREERSAEAAASRCSPSSSSSSSSRLASTEVSGVRSSCEASATNSRWRASAASVSRARLVERVEHRLERARELGDLVLGLRAAACRRTGRACARSRARRRSAPRSAPWRGARWRGRPAARAAPPPSTPKARNTRTRLTVACTSESRRAYWMTAIAGSRSSSTRPRLDPPAVDVDRRPRSSGPKSGASRGSPDHVAVAGDDRAPPRSGGAGVVVEVRAAGLRDVARAVGPRDEPQLDLARELVGGVGDLAAEVALDPLRRQHADDRGEAAEDDQRQRCGAAGEPPADRQPPIRGGRIPRRGPYGGAEARHRLRASFAGWRRTPRSCS